MEHAWQVAVEISYIHIHVFLAWQLTRSRSGELSVSLSLLATVSSSTVIGYESSFINYLKTVTMLICICTVYSLLIYVYRVSPVCMNVHCVHVWCPWSSKESSDARNWIYRWLWGNVWVLGIEPRFAGETSLHWAISIISTCSSCFNVFSTVNKYRTQTFLRVPDSLSPPSDICTEVRFLHFILIRFWSLWILFFP